MPPTSTKATKKKSPPSSAVVVNVPEIDPDEDGTPRACFSIEKHQFFTRLIEVVHEGGEQLVTFHVADLEVKVQTYLDAGASILSVRLQDTTTLGTTEVAPIFGQQQKKASLLRRSPWRLGEEKVLSGTEPVAGFSARFDVASLLKLLKSRPKSAERLYLLFFQDRLRVGYMSGGQTVQEDELVESTSAQMEDVYDLEGVVDDQGEPVQQGDGGEDDSLLDSQSTVVLSEPVKGLLESLSTSTVDHQVIVRAESKRLAFVSRQVSGCAKSKRFHYVSCYQIYRPQVVLTFMPKIVKLMFLFWDLLVKAGVGDSRLARHSLSDSFWKTVYHDRGSGTTFTWVGTTCEEEATGTM